MLYEKVNFCFFLFAMWLVCGIGVVLWFEKSKWCFFVMLPKIQKNIVEVFSRRNFNIFVVKLSVIGTVTHNQRQLFQLCT